MKAIPAVWLALLLFMPFVGGCAPAKTKTMKQVDVTLENENSAITNGFQFLLTQQNRDGSFGTVSSLRPFQIYIGTETSVKSFQQATTGICCMALLAKPGLTETEFMTLKKAFHFLMETPPQGRATGDEIYINWGVCFVTQALVRALDRDDLGYTRRQVLAKIDRWLTLCWHLQSVDGGWGYYAFDIGTQQPSGSESTCFLTAGMLIMIHEAEERGVSIPEKQKRAAITSLKRLRTPDRTFIYGNYARFSPGTHFNRPKGTLGRVQGPNTALNMYNEGVTQDDIKLGLDRLIEHHHFIEIARTRPMPHETWYANAGYYYFYGHFYASLAIERLAPEDRAKYRDELSGFMLNSQQKDGSWWDFPLYGMYKSYGTGLALMTLMKCHHGKLRAEGK